MKYDYLLLSTMETEETMEKSGKVIAESDCNWISKRTIE